MKHLVRVLLVLAACAGMSGGCTAMRGADPVAQFPPAPTFPPGHRYSLDELIELSIHRNASLDVARYEAEAALGLVDQVKALWLPAIRYNFAAVAYDNDLNYKARALGLVSVNAPLTGTYNLINALSYAQILSTGGKRTSGLKQAKMYAAIKRLDVLRQQDLVAFNVANFYHLVCLTHDVDMVLEDTIRRLRVFRQVAGELTERGSLRASRLDSLQADYLVSQLEQLRIAVQAGRQQAYEALRHFVGVSRDEPFLLKDICVPPALELKDVLSVYATVVRAFLNRPEARQVDLFKRIREAQVDFAKAAWSPNVAFLGTATDIQGNHHTVLEHADGLIASLIVDIPIYDPSRRGRLREALGLEQASVAFQRQVEELITLEAEVTAIDCQRALATALNAARARQIAAEHYDAAREAFSRELIPASDVVIAIALDMLGKLQHLQADFAYHNARAQLHRVTAERDEKYGY